MKDLNRINELVEKEFITLNELEELLTNVENYEFNGESGLYYGYLWYTVICNDCDFDVYVKHSEEN